MNNKNTITTTSGTYTVKQYKKIENEIKKAFWDLWENKITIEEHKKILKNSGLNYGEIKSIQYQASIEK